MEKIVFEDDFLDLIFIESADELKAKLIDLGLSVNENSDGSITIKNPNHSMNVGFKWEGLDFPTRRTQLGFALFGIPNFLNQRYPNLDSKLKKRWKELSKNSKKIKQEINI